MPIRLQSPHRQAGLSLLEVLIATVVLSAGLLGLAGLQIAGMKTTHNSYQMQQATWIVYDLLERMRANKQAAENDAYAVDSSSTHYCSSRTSPDSEAREDKDIYEIMCGVVNTDPDAEIDNITGINNVLMGGVYK